MGHSGDHIGGKAAARPAQDEPWQRWAALRMPILLRGERGTGKSFAASRIHEASRRTGAFVALPMTHLPPELEIVELVGSVKGSYTSSVADRPGAFARANNGSLFLDEVGRASLRAQGVLLTLLDTGRFTPIGAAREISVDARLVLATNSDLEQMVSEETFLPDLLDRIGYFVLTLPPLRERRSTIVPLVLQVLRDQCAAQARITPSLSPDVTRIFARAPWPGNIRQVIKVCEWICVHAEEEVQLGDLPSAFLAESGAAAPANAPLAVRASQALAASGGNRSEAARSLGISRSHFYRVIRADRQPRDVDQG